MKQTIDLPRLCIPDIYTVLDDRCSVPWGLRWGEVGRVLDMHRVSVVELHIKVAVTIRTSDPHYIEAGK